MATTASKTVVIRRNKSPASPPQKTTWTEHPKLTRIEFNAPLPPPKVGTKAKAEAKTPTPPPTPRPADGMNTRQRRNARKRQEFLESPEFDAIAEAMVTRWPSIFRAEPDQVKPFAIGFGRELIAALSEFRPLQVSEALRIWIGDHKYSYWDALIAGGPRYDLQGNPKGEVTPEQQAIAREQRKAWCNRREERYKKREDTEHALSMGT